MRARAIVIVIAVILGGLAGGTAVLSLARTPPARELRVEGRTLREWARLLGDESDPARRDSAWRVLPQFSAADVAAVLVENLDGGSSDTADRAEAVLVKLGAVAVPALTAGVSDPSSPERRAASIEVLRRIGRPSAPAADAIAAQIVDLTAGPAALKYLLQHGISSSAIEGIIKSLEVGGSNRHDLVQILSRFPGDARARAAILREAKSQTRDGVQVMAFRSLAAMPNPTAEEIDAVAGMLEPRDTFGAMRPLVQIGPPAAPVILRRFAKHPNAGMRGMAAQTLAVIAIPPASSGPLTVAEAKVVGEALSPFLGDEDASTAVAAAKGMTALWRRGDFSALPSLRSASANERRFALDAIARYRLGATLDDVLPLTGDPDRLVRESAVHAARSMWPAERDAEVLAFERESDAARRAKLVRLLPVCSDRGQATDALLTATRDLSPQVRQAAVETLAASLHLRDVVDRLIEMLGDESPAVRTATAGVLAKAKASPHVAAALSASGQGR